MQLEEYQELANRTLVKLDEKLDLCHMVMGIFAESSELIDAIRKDEVPGTHSVFYKSEVDEIEIKHTAFNRNGFAMGAIVAAEWILGKKGIFSMKDVLGLN